MAHAADCVAQRLKSLEMTASGSNWAVSQRVEVVPPEKGQLSSRAEAQAAAKENKEEMKSRNLAKGKDKGKGEYSQGYWRSSGKGDQKGKEGRRQGGEQAKLLQGEQKREEFQVGYLSYRSRERNPPYQNQLFQVPLAVLLKSKGRICREDPPSSLGGASAKSVGPVWRPSPV